jgi:hypothetical protein
MSTPQRDRALPDIYVCPQCGTRIDVPSGEAPKVGIKASSGTPNVWVVTAGRVEIHRCDIRKPRRTALS